MADRHPAIRIEFLEDDGEAGSKCCVALAYVSRSLPPHLALADAIRRASRLLAEHMADEMVERATRG